MRKKCALKCLWIAIYIFPIELLIAEKEEVRSTLAPFYGLADFIAALSVLFSIIIIVLVGIVKIERNKKHINFFFLCFSVAFCCNCYSMERKIYFLAKFHFRALITKMVSFGAVFIQFNAPRNWFRFAKGKQNHWMVLFRLLEPNYICHWTNKGFASSRMKKNWWIHSGDWPFSRQLQVTFNEKQPFTFSRSLVHSHQKQLFSIVLRSLFFPWNSSFAFQYCLNLMGINEFGAFINIFGNIGMHCSDCVSFFMTI